VVNRQQREVWTSILLSVSGVLGGVVEQFERRISEPLEVQNCGRLARSFHAAEAIWTRCPSPSWIKDEDKG